MSTKLPTLTPKRLLRALERAGFVIHHVTGSHYVLRHGTNVRLRVTLPWHNQDLKRGTLAAILEQAQLTTDDLRELL